MPYVAAEPFEAVIAPPGVVGRRSGRGFLDQAQQHELFQVVVERAGAGLVLTGGLPGDLLHDSVTVEVFAGEGEEDVQ